MREAIRGPGHSHEKLFFRGASSAPIPGCSQRHPAFVVDVRDGPKRTLALVHRGEASLTYGARALKKFLLERLKK